MVLPIKIHFPGWVSKAERRFLRRLSHLKVVWKAWDLRTLILLSLSLQVTLIFLAPFRKKTSNGVVLATIWLAYLIADYIAILAIGLIPNYSVDDTVPLSSGTHPDLLAFWAPFLVVHLGGPDTITALALEDNELWLRTGLHLFTYMAATGRVFFQSLPTNTIYIPTILIFFAGFLKYCERTLSMYHSRLTQLRPSIMRDPDPGPNYPKIMEAYDSFLVTSVPVRFDTNPDQSVDEHKNVYESSHEDQLEVRNNVTNVKLARDAFAFFERFKGVYVDTVFTFQDRMDTREYFLDQSLTPEKAFTVIEMELNFTHEHFFTKMSFIHQKLGAIIRHSCFAFQLGALLIWILFIDKKPFHWFDIWITYILLLGAVAIDSVAFLMLLLSDWQLANLSRESQTRASLYEKLLSVRERTWGSCWGPKECPLWPRTRRILFRRWSESVGQFNLIEYCIDPWSDSTQLLFKVLPPLKGKCDQFNYVSKRWFADDLRDFIFNQLRFRALMAQKPKHVMEICRSKGDWILRTFAGADFEPFLFYKYTEEVEYEESLLMWHIATQLLYMVPEKDSLSAGEQVYRKCSKTLSDYMMYILNWQRGLMPAQASITEVRLGDTCAEATLFFSRYLPEAKRGEIREERLRIGCRALMEVNTSTPPRDIKGDRSKSVLFDAVILAKQLLVVAEQSTAIGMWELIAKVWVDLMCYSASNGRASNHAGQLKQGGELLTLVWLLMLHFGLGVNFRITQGNARSTFVTS